MTRYLLYILSPALSALLMHAQPAQEYALKAAVIYNITKFVEWPPYAFKTPSDTLNVCVLGENPFGDALKQALGGKLHENRTFTVREVREAGAASGCHVLFVSASEQKRFRSILEQVSSRATLTIGDADDFALAGGIVDLRLKDLKIQLQVNLAAADRSRIRISSRLLSLAEIIGK